MTGSAGTGIVPIQQPYLAMTYVIALYGIFPSRSRRARNLRADGLGNSSHTRSGDAFTTQSYEPYLGKILYNMVMLVYIIVDIVPTCIHDQFIMMYVYLISI